MFTLQGQHLNRRGKQLLSRRVADYVLNLRHGENGRFGGTIHWYCKGH